MGRPPLAKKERRVTHLSVRFTEGEHRAAERAAKTAGVGLSEWARNVILAASLPGRPDPIEASRSIPEVGR
jgi:predicted HicB family RNase H-like nuclease